VFVAYPAYVRDKARQMRVESGLTSDELAERLAISRQTIYYWVRDLPIEREPRWNPHGGAAAMKTKYQILREAAYTEGLAEFGELARERSFRDFICMYIGEGYRRNRNTVALANSNPRVVVLAALDLPFLEEQALLLPAIPRGSGSGRVAAVLGFTGSC
jgi:DNA-binding XRE family transcriptional regulator